MIQSPFSNRGSPAAETIGGEARFSYVPPTAVSDATAAGVSVHPAETTRSYTAGEIDGVIRFCQEKLKQVQKNMTECKKNSCRLMQIKTVLKYRPLRTFNRPLKEESITYIINIFTEF